MMRTLKRLMHQPRPVYGPWVRKYQLATFWLAAAVAVGLPALLCLVIVLGQVGTPR